MKKIFLLLLCVSSFTLYSQQTYYVTPTGLAGNSGASFATPKSLTNALAIAAAGDEVILQSGTYTIPYTAGLKNTIYLTQSGTSSAYINVHSEPNTLATIDFQFPNFAWVQDSYGISLTGSYWKFKGLIITRAGYQGVYVEGGYNTFEYCIFYDNRNSGLEINKGGHHTTVLNCDAYHNYDPKKGGSMADGYAVKQLQGAGNQLLFCRSWDNSDDSYDTFDSPEFVILRGCWAFNSGIDIWNDPNIAFSGNGNGFKVGGNGALQNNVLSHCVSFGHPSKGFDQNNNTGGITVYNCTSYKNSINYGMGGALAAGEKHIVKNCISLSSTNANSFGTATQSNNSWSSGFSVGTGDFLSLDLTLADDPRNPDGSLPNNNLFRLKTTSALVDAGVNVGLAYNGTAPDLGAFETGGVAPTLTDPANKTQSVVSGTAIANIVFTWGGGATDVTISALPAGVTSVKNVGAKTLTISGSPTATGTYTVTTIGGTGAAIVITGTITATLNPPTLTNPANKTQSVVSGTAIANIVFTWGGGATDVIISGLPIGVSSLKNVGAKTLTFYGSPTETATYTVTTVGGTGAAVVITGTITATLNPPTLTNPANKTQSVVSGTAITDIIFTWGGGATDVIISGLPIGVSSLKNVGAKTLTFYGSPTETVTYTVTTVGGTGAAIVITGTITATTSTPSLTDPANKSQTIVLGDAIANIVFTWGDGATDVTVANLPAGLTATKNIGAKTLTISGTPSAVATTTYTVTTVGGTGAPIVLSGTITTQAVVTCLQLVTIPISALASTGTYSMVLFDAPGTTQIKVLGKGVFNAGDSDFVFAKTGLSSGTYTFKLMNGATVIKTGTVILP